MFSSSLPWWFVFVGWGLIISICVLSSYVTIMYGLSYGYTTSLDWVINYSSTVLHLMGVSQPFKIAAVVSFLTLIFHQPVEPISDASQLINIGKCYQITLVSILFASLFHRTFRMCFCRVYYKPIETLA